MESNPAVKKNKGPLPIRHIVVWAVVVFCICAMIPLAVATTWAPRCESCHIAEVDAVHKSYHPDVSCGECHLSGGWTQRFNTRATVWYQMVFRVGTIDSTLATAVSNVTCVACHTGADTLGRTSRRGIVINHTECVKALECITCHANMGHQVKGTNHVGFTMNSCIRCHATRGTAKAGGCDVCHDSASTEKRERKTTSFSVTHSKDWKKMHGLGDTKTCSSCHNSNDCARCHGLGVPHWNGFFSQHSGFAVAPNAKCETCHEDKKFCNDCHGTEMPHPGAFLAEHSSLVKTDGDKNCYNCHPKSDCQACHNTHIHPGGAKL